jgi:hypothetical protein
MLGIVGIGLLVCAAAVFFGWVLPIKAEVSDMQGRLSVQQQRGQVQAPLSASPDPLSDFYTYFPVSETTAQWLGKVYAVAEKQKLNLPRGEYRLTSPADEPIATYEAIFALRGRYPQLRAFIAGVLEEVPVAALDDVRLERQRTADNMVDARLRLTFFLRTH